MVKPRDPSASIIRFLVQELFGNLTQVAIFLYRGQTPFEWIDVVFSSDDPSRFRSALGTNVHFNQPENRIVASNKILAEPLETADPFVLHTLIPILDALNEQEGELQSLLSHIEALLTQRLPEVATMPDIAHQLNMSERSLRRKLVESGTSYREILDRVRQARAFEMIMHTELPLQSIAEQLGFDDARSLRRRLKDWTGKSVRELRQEEKTVLPDS